MDLPLAWCEVCLCGRTFSSPQAYSYHRRGCQKTKKRLSGALEKAKGIWQAKKRQKTEGKASNETSAGPSDLNITPLPASNATQEVSSLPENFSPHGINDYHQDAAGPTVMDFEDLVQAAMESEDVDQPLLKRRRRRENRQLPKRYRDVLPQPAEALPPTPQSPQNAAHPEPVTLPPTHEVVPTALPSAPTRVSKILNSARNIFGLFRQYHATRFPEHDPDVNTASDDLVKELLPDPSPSVLDPYKPYPNQSSYLLGEWYWNDGVKKSQSSFKNLISIVGHPDFQAQDVGGTNWTCINRELGGVLWGGEEENEEGWEDEKINEGWHETPIKIKVPFNRLMKHPGQAEFEVGKLHHRKLTSVIREKILSPSSHPHLHFEPYKLYWEPNETSQPARVHGELYSSDAFIDAHDDLQNAPGEPGCELPRVVVGLMFASDGTQLTAFSNAKLWPVYLTFGNESKDRRSKPSCHAFEHIAYFQTVRIALVDSFCETLKLFHIIASRLL
jgi:hypothetical protein